jgi:hypothetical protein
MVHFATLTLNVAFTLGNPGEETIKNIARQAVVQEDCHTLDRNRAIAQFVPMSLKHSFDERGCSRRAMLVPRFADFRAVPLLRWRADGGRPSASL